MVDAFTDIAAMTPLPISSANLSTPQDSLSTDPSFGRMDSTGSAHAPPSSSPLLPANSPLNESGPSGSTATPTVSGLAPPLTVNSSCASVAEGGSSTPSRSSGESSVVKYLQLPSCSKRQTVTKSTRAMTGARVLTSAQCIAILKEKELKKKQQEEEKEKRKQIRE